VHLGLRARIVVVMTVISALTLAVAAVTLLSPLEHRLQLNVLNNFAVSLRNERGAVATIDVDTLRPGNRRLARAARVLARHNGAEVSVFTAAGRLLISTDPDDPAVFHTRAAATAKRQTQRALVGSGGAKVAEVSVPVRTGGRLLIVSARRRIGDSHAATAVVRHAFTLAAAAGIVGALLVGLLLSSHLVRRIRHLRDTALRVADIGPNAEFKPDGERDEIGDLSQAFATMQTRLREQEQARRAFVGTASHELRTPLASLSVMVDMLLSDLRASPPHIDGARLQAEKAEVQVERLSSLAGELLDLSRLDARLPLRAEPVELSAILRSVVAELSVRLDEQGQRIDVGGERAAWALGDPGGVAQIIRVLLDNALRHNPDGAEVSAHVELTDHVARIVVADDGPGVAASDRDRIFERFARGAQATDGGFGLGLAIGRELARQMDGDLVLEGSEGGARFALRLQAAATP
jgi:signal transduction histidine kinase